MNSILSYYKDLKRNFTFKYYQKRKLIEAKKIKLKIFNKNSMFASEKFCMSQLRIHEQLLK